VQRLTAGICVALALAPAAVARADDPDDPDEATAKAEARREDEQAKREEAEARNAEILASATGVKLTFRLGVRFLSAAPFSKTYESVLTAYGFDSMSAVVEGAADAGISPWRFLDLGVHTGYSFGSGGTAAGSSGGLLAFHDLEVGGFAYAIFGRKDRRRAGDFGGGVEGGAMFPFLVLNGDVSRATLPYIGPVVLARLFGDARVQTAVHVRYLVANWSNAFGSVGLPVGGFSISVGANLAL